MSFKDIRGQERPIEFLKNAVKNDKVSHAYLFTGPESVGKKLVARTLAKVLNCDRQELNSCDSCSACLKIDKLIHLDVNWISAEGETSTIKIGQIRWLKDNIGLKPYEGKMKCFIIDNAHQMTDEAANSLLKILEEPPPRSVLILISDKPERLFFTIKSRCQIVKFKPMSSIELEKILRDEYVLAADTSHFLAYFSSGRIGKALALKKENTLEWKNQVIDKFDPLVNRNSMASTKNSTVFNDDNFFFDNDREKILEMLDILSIWYRDILILKSTGVGQLVINKDRIEDIKLKTTQHSRNDLLEILEEIKKASFLIQQNVNPKLTLSSLAVQIGV